MSITAATGSTTSVNDAETTVTTSVNDADTTVTTVNSSVTDDGHLTDPTGDTAGGEDADGVEPSDYTKTLLLSQIAIAKARNSSTIVDDKTDEAGEEFDADEPAAKAEKADKGPSPATVLVEIALGLYAFGMTTNNQPYLIHPEQPSIARLLGDEERTLREEMAYRYFCLTGKVPSKSALSDAVQVLRGIATRCTPVDVALRSGVHNNSIVIDLGTPDASCVIVDKNGWTVPKKSPILFYRTPVTGALPTPTQPSRGCETGKLAGSDLRTMLARFVNVPAEFLPLVESWLVSTFLPDLAHPIAILRGTHGSGKTKAASVLNRLVDPSLADLRAVPRTERDWAASAACSSVVAFDNVSSIPQWLSDALCRVVTGGTHVGRQLYTDNGVSLVKLKRTVLMTTIEVGHMAADLESRSLPLDLNPLEGRRTETEIDADFAACYPAMFGALLTRLSQVLSALPHVKVDNPPRLADFAEIVAANDAVSNSTGYDQLFRLAIEAGADQVEASGVGRAIVAFAATLEGEHWQGTKSQLLAALAPHWPKGVKVPADATRLSQQLSRVLPSLGAWRIQVRYTRTNKARLVTINKLDAAAA